MLKKFVFSFITVIPLVLFFSLIWPTPLHACLCAGVGSPDFTLCNSEPGHLNCTSPAGVPYACCYTPPADPIFCQPTSCPPFSTPIPTSTPAPCPIGECRQLDDCDVANIDYTRICSGLFVCCSAVAVPTPTTVPTPTLSVCTPADSDPNCGGHLQPCCCSVTVGDCDINNPPLHCGLNYGFGIYRCCLQNDPEAACWTDPAVTPILPNSDNTQVFCEDDVPTSGIRTAIGCIQASSPKEFINQLLSWAIRISSGVIFILLAYSGLLMITAAGDQKQAARAQVITSAALTGLAIIILSTLILNLLGVRIFNLDIFGFRV